MLYMTHVISLIYNISTKVVPWCCGMPKKRSAQRITLRDARTVPIASPSAMNLQLKKNLPGTLHFQGCFLNQVDGVSFFQRNHLHSCDAGTLGHDRLHLFLRLQFEDSFCNQNHVGAIAFRRHLADHKMHIAVTHVEANCLLQLAKGLHPDMLGRLRLHCHHLLILQHDDLVIPRARLNDPGFVIFCPHQHSDIARKNCRGPQLDTEAREQQVFMGALIGNTIPVALWFSTRTTFLIIGRLASEYFWHRAAWQASTWNWHSGKFSIAESASCGWRTPCAAAGTLDLPPGDKSTRPADHASSRGRADPPCSWHLPATATSPHPPRLSQLRRCDLPKSLWPRWILLPPGSFGFKMYRNSSSDKSRRWDCLHPTTNNTHATSPSSGGLHAAIARRFRQNRTHNDCRIHFFGCHCCSCTSIKITYLCLCHISHRSTALQTNTDMIHMQISRSHGQPLQKPGEM